MIHANASKSKLSELEAENQRLRKAAVQLIEKYPKATDVEIELLIYDLHKALV